jgi:hypothetical protein
MDALRGRALSALGPLAPRLLRDREHRVAVYGLTSVALALAFTFAAPMFLLAIGPLVLGVPHLAADVRYLVAQPGLHRRSTFWLFVAAPAGAAFVYPHAWVSMLAIVGAALIARAPYPRRVVAALAGVALVAACLRFGRALDVVIAHAHNAIAVALFCVWGRRRSRHHLLVVLAFAAGLLAVGVGAFDGAPSSRLMTSHLLDPEDLVSSLAPLSDPVLAVRAVLAFAFAQSVHYAVWVRLVPEEARERPGLRSFSSSLRALAAEIGRPLVAAFALAALGVAAWGCVSLVAARDGYLRLAVFHGPLELGAAALLLLERGSLRDFGGAVSERVPDESNPREITAKS